MAKLDIILEQSSFLLEKQKELAAFYKKEFEGIYELLDTEKKKAEKAKSGADLISFQNVHSMLSDFEEETLAEIDEDIDFLEEQISAVNQIVDMDDKAQAEGLTEMLIDKDQELTETSVFKSEVDEEVEQVTAVFTKMTEDIKTTLVEDGIKELEDLLEAMVVDEDDDEEDDDEDDEDYEDEDEEDDEECEASCHSCSGCHGSHDPKNGPKKGTDKR